MKGPDGLPQVCLGAHQPAGDGRGAGGLYYTII